MRPLALLDMLDHMSERAFKGSFYMMILTLGLLRNNTTKSSAASNC